MPGAFSYRIRRSQPGSDHRRRNAVAIASCRPEYRPYGIAVPHRSADSLNSDTVILRRASLRAGGSGCGHVLASLVIRETSLDDQIAPDLSRADRLHAVPHYSTW
jgi:hypothetical protein